MEVRLLSLLTPPHKLTLFALQDQVPQAGQRRRQPSCYHVGRLAHQLRRSQGASLPFRLPSYPLIPRLSQFFNNEKFEVAQYDKAMKDYTKASVKISTSLAALNIGQNAIFSSALTAMMYLACRGIVDGEFLSALETRGSWLTTELHRYHDCR